MGKKKKDSQAKSTSLGAVKGASGKRKDKSISTYDADAKNLRRQDRWFIGVGLFFFVVSASFVGLVLARCKWIPQCLWAAYVGCGLIPISAGLFLRGAFRYWVKNRRSVPNGELNDLYSEVESYRENSEKREYRLASAERAKLQSLSLVEPVFEIDVLPFRKALVGVYCPEPELIGKAKREEGLRNDYMPVLYQGQGERWKKEINQLADKIEKLKDKEDPPKDAKNPSAEAEGSGKELENCLNKLRASLKVLREMVTWYDQTWAIGELFRDCITWWVAVAALAGVFAGILPVVHVRGDWNLNIAHWIVLGGTGALLSILTRLHNLDLPELGETAGKELMQGAVRSIVIGGATAMILYAAIWGGVIEGPVFPKLPTGQICQRVEKGVIDDLAETGKDSSDKEAAEDLQDTTDDTVCITIDGSELRNVGLSIFWAVFAGFSPVVLKRMTRFAESSLGEEKEDEE